MSENRSGVSKRLGKKTIAFMTGCSLNSLAVNPKAEMLAVAGRNVLWVFSIQEDKFVPLHRIDTPSRLAVPDLPKSQCNVDTISNTSSPSNVFMESTPNRTTPIVRSVNPPRSHSVTDVTWSLTGDILATSSTGGDVILWDVSRTMTQTACFSGHSRSIHCIHFNPSVATELVTASQDGKLKLFDVRDPNFGSSCRTFIQRTASASPVRDVSFCPKQPYLIAAAQENGVVSIWDTRQGSRPFGSFGGHSCSITSLDWHPNWDAAKRNWIVTAGVRDYLIKVWNLNHPNSSLSHLAYSHTLYTIRTMNVNRVRWRPNFRTQIVSSCNLTIDLSVYLWDLQRPSIPYASFPGHKELVTGISWCPNETDNFYTIGRDGLLIRHNIEDGYRPAENSSPVALCISSRGHLVHSVSKDRILSNELPPMIDENNIITQSLFYKAIKHSDSLNENNNNNKNNNNNSNNKSRDTNQDMKIPSGFYAFSSQNPNSNLPIMGSIKSAKLFVSQAQSLLFHFELMSESLHHSQWISLSNALLPDLIIALARNYKFIGSNVDEICAHNATISLRFGQTFLFQFWSLLRAIYGGLNMEPNKRNTIVPTNTANNNVTSLISTTAGNVINATNTIDCNTSIVYTTPTVTTTTTITTSNNTSNISEFNSNIISHSKQLSSTYQTYPISEVNTKLMKIYSTNKHHHHHQQQQQQQHIPSNKNQGNEFYDEKFNSKSLSHLDNLIHTNPICNNNQDNTVKTTITTFNTTLNNNYDNSINSGLHHELITNSFDQNTSSIRLSHILECLGIYATAFSPKSSHNSTNRSSRLSQRRYSADNIDNHTDLNLHTKPSSYDNHCTIATNFIEAGQNYDSDRLFNPRSLDDINTLSTTTTMETNAINHILIETGSINHTGANNKTNTNTNNENLLSIHHISSSLHSSGTELINKQKHDVNDVYLTDPHHLDLQQQKQKQIHHISNVIPIQHFDNSNPNSYHHHHHQHHHQQQQLLHSNIYELKQKSPKLDDTNLLTDLNHMISPHHLITNLQDPIDYLFHYNNNNNSPPCRIIMEQNNSVDFRKITNETNNITTNSTSTTTNTDSINQKIYKNKKREINDTQIDNQEMDVFGISLAAQDDPILVNDTFLPDEAFEIQSIPNSLINLSKTEQHSKLSGKNFNLIKDKFNSEHDKNLKHYINLSLNATSISIKNNELEEMEYLANLERNNLNKKLKNKIVSNSLTNRLRTYEISKQKIQNFNYQNNLPTKSVSSLLAPFDLKLFHDNFNQYSSNLISSSIRGSNLCSPEINSIVIKWFMELVESGHVQTVCTALLALGPERLRLSEWINESRVENWFISYLELLSRFRLWTISARIIKQCGNSKGGADSFSHSKEFRRSINLQHSNRQTIVRSSATTTTTTSDQKLPTASGELKNDPPRTRWKSGGCGITPTPIEYQTSARNSHVAKVLAPSVAALNQASTTLPIRCGLCSKPLFTNEATQRATGHAGWACSRHTTTADPANITCALCHLTVRGLFVWCRGCSHGGHLDHMQAWLFRRAECPAGCGHRCRVEIC